jgi:hypothetical protein
MNKALTIFRKYPPPMIIRNDNFTISLQKKMLEITKPKKIKRKEIIFCPIWVRRFF